MRARVPSIHCDDEAGCTEWATDDYELLVDTVNGVKITRQHRALGWVSTDTEDFCPEHAPTTSPTTQEEA